jgi:hypothetical protein
MHRALIKVGHYQPVASILFGNLVAASFGLNQASLAPIQASLTPIQVSLTLI